MQWQILDASTTTVSRGDLRMPLALHKSRAVAGEPLQLYALQCSKQDVRNASELRSELRMPRPLNAFDGGRFIALRDGTLACNTTWRSEC